MSPRTGQFFSAKQAAAELGVGLPTIYAYVSRGLLRSTPREGRRDHHYLVEDVRVLAKRRTDIGNGRAATAGSPSHTGMPPTVDTELGLITGERLYYRGVDAVKLSESGSLEQAASLLWGSPDLAPFRGATPPRSALLSRLRGETRIGPVARCLAALPIAAGSDPSARTKTNEGRWQTGARIQRLMLEMMTGRQSNESPIHIQLAAAWAPGRQEVGDLLRRCLVLTAEHELNVSTYTVRCAVSAGASLYHGVGAGLAALTGPLHGGATYASEKLIRDLLADGKPADVIARYIDAGLPFVGFGHPLYANGDPRAQILIKSLRAATPKNSLVALAHEATLRIREAVGLRPNIDFALALVEQVLGLPRDSALCLFALGRTAGWIGHAIEQYKSGTMIRPRARYVGPAPKEKL